MIPSDTLWGEGGSSRGSYGASGTARGGGDYDMSYGSSTGQEAERRWFGTTFDRGYNDFSAASKHRFSLGGLNFKVLSEICTFSFSQLFLPVRNY